MTTEANTAELDADGKPFESPEWGWYDAVFISFCSADLFVQTRYVSLTPPQEQFLPERKDADSNQAQVEGTNHNNSGNQQT